MSAERQSPEPRAADERTALRSVPIFAEIDDEQLDQLTSAVDRRHVPANEWLFHMGDPPDAIYVIASGRFAAVDLDGQVLREMASGDSIGDLGVITGAPRSAGIRALRDGVVWRIAADTFTEVLAKAPQLRSAMFRAMAGMLRESRSANISRRPRVIGVLSTGDAVAVPIVDAIVTRLGSHGQTAVVAPPVDTTAAANHYGEFVDEFSETLIGRSEATIGSWWWPIEARATSGDDMSSPKATDSWSLRIKPIRRKRSIHLLPKDRST